MIINNPPQGELTPRQRAIAVSQYAREQAEKPSEPWPFPLELIPVGNSVPKFNPDNYEISPY